MSLNRVIGRDNQIPWHLPEDFKWFKSLTSGHFVLMGRKTLESMGRPLPNRTNVVVSRNVQPLAHDESFLAKYGPVIVEGWEERLVLPGPVPPATREVWLIDDPQRFAEAHVRAQPPRDLFLIGGAQLYAQFLGQCSDLYLSVVQREVEGDAWFPAFEDGFDLVDVPLRTPDFEVRHFRNRALLSPP